MSKRSKSSKSPATKGRKPSETLVKEAVRKNQWILLVGGTCDERESLARIVHNSKGKPSDDLIRDIIKHSPRFYPNYDPTPDAIKLMKSHYPLERDFIMIGVDGCDAKEMSDCILGPEIKEKEMVTQDEFLSFRPITNIFRPEKTLFIDNLCLETKEHINVIKRVTEHLRVYKSSCTEFGMFLVGLESKKDINKLKIKLPVFVSMFEVVPLSEVKTKEKDTFDDVRLKITIDDDNNLRNAIINIHISINDTNYEKLELEDRILPVLYILADTVKHGKGRDGNLVTNKDLKKGYEHVDEAKCKIVKSFAKHIGKKRAGKLIKVEHRIGKRFLIPKKNITISKTKSSL